ncbi:Zinc finger RING/FYVE/PHD-type protein [Dioscorea alata]|uniref:Zinc finger RING/FYVE/PHD-type protein n=1 Tax=Dioscorea alata TaxID=55571 RepID=A0ACB7WV40_DIOAL|nr:Zinc finger RING/FYVE/PHD-type protein [Dioscorea alata]
MSNIISFVMKTLRLRGSVFTEKLIVLKPNKAVDDDGDCCVCLSSLAGGAATRKLPCRHLFHRECVNRWLALCQRTCPLCRVCVDGQGSKREELTEELVIWFSSFHVAGF